METENNKRDQEMQRCSVSDSTRAKFEDRMMMASR
jgi:hypothetical protein